jgi:hypothetical protein
MKVNELKNSESLVLEWDGNAVKRMPQEASKPLAVGTLDAWDGEKWWVSPAQDDFRLRFVGFHELADIGTTLAGASAGRTVNHFSASDRTAKPR